jgi:predicted TIM-barrel fold metal-dependent hydrolase
MNFIDLNAWLGTWPFRDLRDNDPASLLTRLERAGIQRAAVSQIEAAFQRNVQHANERLAQSVESYADRLLPIATINPRFPHWEQDLRRCHEDLGFKGVRLFPCYHDYPANDPEAIRVAHLCAERNLPVFLPHRLEDARQRHWMDPGRTLDLAEVADMIAAVPNATIVVTNARGILGSALWKRQDLRGANWFYDLSLSEVHYKLHTSVSNMRDLAEFIDQGGARHLVFGTHTPFSYPSAARVKTAVLPVDAETLVQICSGRAEKMLGLT